MGNPVIVDSDDLEAIVMSTGVIKQMEKVLQAHKRDPFAWVDDNKLSQAHNRLSVAMVRAKRGELHPEYDEPLTDQALLLLKNIDFSLDQKRKFAIYRVDPMWMKPGGTPPAGFSELRTKGMIEIGSVFEYVLWQSEPTQTRIDKAEFRLRLTDRGQNLLLDIATKEKSTIQ